VGRWGTDGGFAARQGGKAVVAPPQPCAVSERWVEPEGGDSKIETVEGDTW
jgi:hypothetical protein